MIEAPPTTESIIALDAYETKADLLHYYAYHESVFEYVEYGDSTRYITLDGERYSFEERMTFWRSVAVQKIQYIPHLYNLGCFINGWGRSTERRKYQ